LVELVETSPGLDKLDRRDDTPGTVSIATALSATAAASHHSNGSAPHTTSSHAPSGGAKIIDDRCARSCQASARAPTSGPLPGSSARSAVRARCAGASMADVVPVTRPVAHSTTAPTPTVAAATGTMTSPSTCTASRIASERPDVSRARRRRPHQAEVSSGRPAKPPTRPVVQASPVWSSATSGSATAVMRWPVHVTNVVAVRVVRCG